MTRSPEATWTPDHPAPALPVASWAYGLVVTVAEEGPRRTVLDVLAARSTRLSGPEPAVRGFLERAATELAPRLVGSDGRLVVVRPLPHSPGPRRPEAGEEREVGAVVVASCRDARGLVTAGGTAGGIVGGPVVVLVHPEATGAAGELGALVEAVHAHGRGAIVIGGACPLAREVVEVARGGAGAEGGTEGGAGGEGAAIDLLGPVMVRGAAATLEGHPKLTELATYLALHEHGATSRVWAEALWPDRPVPPQTIANRLSELRRLLGFAPDGRPRLRRDGDRHLLVDVGTDWSTVRVLANPDAGLDQWRRALALVRGRPFTGLRDAGWTQVEGHAAEIERTLTECALRAASALLAADLPGEATWAAEQGLRAVPWDERLHRALMRAGAAAGNLGQVEETLRHLALALEIDGDPLVQVHPETARLYRQLSGRGSVSAR